MGNFKKKVSLTLLILMVITLVRPAVSMANETSVNLGTADSFALLAGSTITNTGTTIINGDVGLHPGTEFTGQGTAIINGDVHITDAVALQAKNDLLAAYNDAKGREINPISSELGGKILTPGVFSIATSLDITGTLTLDGANDPDAVFIFQAGTTLTTASASKVELINGATVNNIFWQVGSSATLGTNSEFVGNILASESITATTGTKIEGKLLALNGAITLDNNTINNSTTGFLTVTKIVDGDTSGTTLSPFEIIITGPEDFSVNKTFVHNESYTWYNLIPGEYNVTENRTGLSSEWTVNGEGDVKIEANQLSQATITNSYTSPIVSIPDDNSSDDDESEDDSDNNDSDDDSNDDDDSDDDSDDSTPVDNTPVDSTPLDNTPVDSTPVAITPVVSYLDSLTVEKEEEIIPPVPNTDFISKTIPQTGQETDYRMAMILGSIGSIFAGIGIVLANKKKKSNE